MKKILSLALASAMVMSMTAGAVAAPATSPVGSISTTGYAYDSDLGAVDLTIPNPDFSYGDTVFYPMLNELASAGNLAIETARTELADAVAAEVAPKATFDEAVITATGKATAVTGATTELANMNLVLVAANAWKNAEGAARDTAKIEYARIAALYNVVDIETDSDVAAVSESETLVANAGTALDTANSEKDTADSAVTAAEGLLNTAKALTAEKQSDLDTLLSTTTQFVHESDAVDNIKVRDSWEINGKLIEDVTVERKKISTGDVVPAEKYIYFVAVEIDESTETDEEDIYGLVELRKSGSDGFEYDDMQLDVSLEVGFTEASDDVITKTPKLFSNGNGFNDDSEDELTFAVDEDSYFTVNTMGQGELLLSMTSRFNNTVADRFPSANLDFLAGNGASFNKIGVMSISATEDAFIYELNEDGSLDLIETEYDDHDEVHNFKTRTLDSYVISDIELEGTGSTTPDEDKDTVTPDDSTEGNKNPNTGAKA